MIGDRPFKARVSFLSVQYLRHTKVLFFERGDCQKISVTYSYRKASTGSSLAARLAG